MTEMQVVLVSLTVIAISLIVFLLRQVVLIRKTRELIEFRTVRDSLDTSFDEEIIEKVKLTLARTEVSVMSDINKRLTEIKDRMIEEQDQVKSVRDPALKGVLIQSLQDKSDLYAIMNFVMEERIDYRNVLKAIVDAEIQMKVEIVRNRCSELASEVLRKNDHRNEHHTELMNTVFKDEK